MTHAEMHPELLLAHSSWLARLARRLVHDEAEADDAVQETWLRVLESEGVAPHSPRAWLAGVLRNVVAGRRRGASRSQAREAFVAREGEAVEGASDTLESLVVLERQGALIELVLALPEEQRRAIVLRYYDELPPRVIAERERTSVHTVKSRLQRGLEKLREELERRHGERGAWAAWLMPLAARSRDGGATALPVMAIGLTLVAVGAAVVALFVGGSFQRDSGAALGPTAQREAPAEISNVTVLDADEGTTARTPAPPPAPNALVVRVVHWQTGVPVEDAQVLAIREDAFDVTRIAEIGHEYWPDVEAFCLAHGERASTGADGTARFEGRGPWLVHASRGEWVGYGNGLEDEAEITVRVRPVRPTRVRVVDEQGVARSGVPIRGRYEVEVVDGPVRSPETYVLERETDAQGEVLFHDPLASHTHPDKIDAEPKSTSWASLRIGLPGVPATWRGGKAPERPIVLVLPPTGELEVRIVDRAGELVPLNGRASLTPPESAWRDSPYAAPLVDGRAVWPRVALNATFRVELALPDEGARWVVEGRGPLTADTRAVLETQRPTRPALVAELVDEDGAPVHPSVAMVYIPGERFPRQFGRLATDTNGRLRLELDDPFEIPAESSAEWAATVVVLGGIGQERWARAPLPTVLGPGETSLGRLVLKLAPQPHIRGRCVDPDGRGLKGINLSAKQLSGVQWGTTSDADGRFEFKGLFGSPATIKALDYDGVWHRSTPALVHEGEGEVLVTMTRSGSFAAQLNVGGLSRHTSRVMALLYDEHGKAQSAATVEQSGALELQNVAPGSYEILLRLQDGSGSLPLLSFDDIVIASGAQTRDRRVDGLDLGALLREVRLTVHGAAPRATVWAALVPDEGPGVALRLVDGHLAVPRGFDGRLVVGSSGMRNSDLGPIDGLTDHVEITLHSGLSVELLPRGKLRVDGMLSLKQDGGPLSEVSSFFIDRLARGEPVTVKLPDPGRYRVVLQTSTSAGGGMMMASDHTTEIEIDVADVDRVQRFEIDLDRVRGE